MAKYEQYAEYKDSGVKWLGLIPVHWSSYLFKRVVSAIKDGTHGTHARVENGELLLSAKNVFNSGIQISENESFIPVKDYEEITSNGFPRKGDILVTCVGTIGRSFVYPYDKSLAFQRSVSFIRLNKKGNAQFYKYFIESKAYQSQLESLVKSSAQGGIYMGDLINTVVINCPLDEQVKIANFLDHETAQIDTLIAKQEKLIELLKEKRQAVISHAVTKGLNSDVTMKDSGVEWLGQVPEHWEIPKLLHITTRIGDGLHSTPLYQEGTGYYFINGNNLVDGQILIGETAKEVPESEFIKHQVTLDNTTVLLSINGTIGKVALFNNEPVILGKSASYMNCCPELVPSFLANYLTTSQAKNYYDLEVTGTTIYNLSLNSIRNMKIPLPPIDEQNSIVVFVAEQYSKYEKLIQSSEKQNELLKERRTALISSAVTGKIDVRNWQNPNKNNDAKTELGV